MTLLTPQERPTTGPDAVPNPLEPGYASPAVRVHGRQRGRLAGRVRAERGHLDLPDHAGLSDGGALRRLVGRPEAEPVGQGPRRHRDAVRGRRRGRAPRCAPEGRPRDDLHGVPGPAPDDPEHVQDRGRADADRDPRRRAHPRHPRPLHLRRPQRRHARPRDGLGDAGGRLRAGGAGLRPRRARRHAPQPGARSCTSSTASAPRTRSTRSPSSRRTTCAPSSATRTSSPSAPGA